MKDEQKYPDDRKMMWRGILIIGGGALFAHVIFPLIWWNFMGGSNYQGQPYDMQTLPEGYRVVRPTPTLTPTVTLTPTATDDARPQTIVSRPQTIVSRGSCQSRQFRAKNLGVQAARLHWGGQATRDPSEFSDFDMALIVSRRQTADDSQQTADDSQQTADGRQSFTLMEPGIFSGQPSAVNRLPSNHRLFSLPFSRKNTQ
jgi:hypothetical protein